MEASEKRASKLLALEAQLVVEKNGELTEAQSSRRDFLKDLADTQSAWEFIIYRTAQTQADVQVLRNSNKEEVAFAYLHGLTK